VSRPIFQSGERVVFCVTKHSARPGPRAHNVDPEPLGEAYSYQVDKYWVVDEAHADGTLVVRTRRGKRHIVSADNPNLRHAHWWERLFFSDRFPSHEPRSDAGPRAAGAGS
jgi:hypothetical protein